MKPKPVIAKLFIRPTIRGKRKWDAVNLKKLYPEKPFSGCAGCPRGWSFQAAQW
jgi:hypothetical protein